MNIDTQTIENGVTIVATSGSASRSGHTETYHNWSIQDITGHYRMIVETYIHINIAINVYEYGRGGKCVNKLTHTYA